MDNVLLIGDSIRLGYEKAVKSSLAHVANVISPAENCRFSSYVLRYLHEYRGLAKGEPIKVVHWNAGLWDCLRMFGDPPLTPLSFYAYYIDSICHRIKKLFPDAVVIFATSTSVITERMSDDFKRYNKEIESYNECASDIAKSFGFIVNDLYSLSLTLPESAHSDGVHYNTPEGTKALASQVNAYIASALGITEEIPYKEDLFTDAPSGI